MTDVISLGRARSTGAGSFRSFASALSEARAAALLHAASTSNAVRFVPGPGVAAMSLAVACLQIAPARAI